MKSDQPLYLGIDFGTTSIKGIIVSAEGHIIAHSSMRRTEVPQDKRDPDHPDAIWNGFTLLIDALRQLAGSDWINVTTIAISGVVPNVCLINADDEVVGPILRYSDRRAYDIELELDSTLANGPWQNEVLSKLIWYRDNVSASPGQDLRIFSPHTWLTYKLTGQYVLDRVSAAEHGCVFDVRQGVWNIDLLRQFNISFVDWPPVMSPFAVAGLLSTAEMSSLGLGNPVKVAVGGPDFLASLMGSGARLARDAMIYLGTYHCGCELSYSLDHIHQGGMSGHAIKWLATIPQAGPQSEAVAEMLTHAKGRSAWQELDRLALSPSLSHDRVFFVPCLELLESTISTRPTSALFLCGPNPDPRSSAEAVFRGAAAGIVVDLRRRGISLDGCRVFISGGACRSRVQRETLAAALQTVLTFIPSSEDGLGSALIGMRATAPALLRELDAGDAWQAERIAPPSAADMLAEDIDFYSRVIQAHREARGGH